MRRYAKYLIGLFGLVFAAWMIFLTAQTSGPAINRWTPTADMATARASACSALLPDGRVLVAGGTGVAGAVSAVELYSANGTFVSGPPMLQARANASCTVMQNGHVLVAGGNDGTRDLASAEVFDPVAGAWSAAADMSVARSGHGALLTPWGAVMIAGGSSNGELTDSVELYSTANTFVQAGSLSSPRKDFAMTAIGAGRILIAGGNDGKSAVSAVDIFDSRSQTVTAAGTMLAARSQLSAATLLDGTVLMAGGYDADGRVLASTEVFDAVKGESAAGPDMTTARAGHQAYALAGNGAVLIVGGTDGKNVLSTSEQYPFWAGRFIPAASMNTARSGQASSQMLRGAVVVAGGRNGSGFLAGSEVYGFATIGTDKPDYSPGSTVAMTGAGWRPGETVSINVTALPADRHSVEFSASAQADAAGRIQISGFHIDQSHLGMKFLMSATGSQSVAQTTFTDSAAPLPILIGFNPASPATAPANVVVSGSYSVLAASGTAQLFVDGVYALQTFTLDGSGLILYSGTSMAVGTHTIVISYFSGDTTIAGDSQASASYTVNGLPTTTVLTVSPGGGTYGTSFLLTGTTTAAMSYPGTGQGTITFYDVTGTPVALAGPIAVNNSGSGGVATATVNNLSVANHSLQAVFTPTPTTSPFLTSSSGTTGVNVTKANPAFTLNVSPNSVGAGASFQVGVTSSSVGANVFPTGTVTLWEGGTQYGVAQSLSGGATTFNVTVNGGLTAGSHTLTISYSGDGNFFSTTNSPSTTFSVAQSTAVVKVTTNPSATISYGAGITYTAQVSAPPANSGSGLAPTGTVVFSDGTNTSGSIALSGGVANWNSLTTPKTVAQSPVTVTVTYGGDTNFAVGTTGSTTYTVTQATSATAISSSQQSAAYGALVTYTAQVTLPNGLTGGTVTFTDSVGASTLCATVALSGSPYTATCPITYNGISQLGSGSHTITATYNPPAAGANIAGSSASLTETIAAVATTTALGSLGTSPTTYGQEVDFQATVSAATGSPTAALTSGDTVQFLNNAAVLATGVLPVSAPPASTTLIKLFNLAPGTYSVTGKYVPAGGNLNYTTSTSSASPFQVNQATTAVTAPATVSTLSYGSPVVLTSQFSVSSSQGVGPFSAPSGTVQLKEGSTVLGTATLGTPSCTGSPVTCTFNSITPSVGNHTYTVLYSGDTNYATSTATDGTPIAVTMANSSTALALNPAGSSALGQAVTFTATVTGTVGGAVPTGTVTFKDGVTVLGTATLNLSGVAVLSGVNTLTLGAHTNSLTANYGGDPNYNTSANTGLSYTVNQDPTTVAVTSSLSSVNVGSSVTLTGTITPTYAPPAAQVPSGGTITFFDNGSSIGTAVTNGTSITFVGTYVWTPAATGSHSITAQYTTGTDANFATSPVSPAITITVNAVTTTTTLGVAPTSTAYGQPVTLTATVAAGGSAPAPAAVADAIQFVDYSTPITTVSLSAAAGGVAISNLAPGSHSIKAVFVPGGADAVTYAGSSSTATGVTVSQDVTTLTAPAVASGTPTFGSAIVLSTQLAVTTTGRSGTYSAPTGSVVLSEGSTVLGTTNLTACTGTPLVCNFNAITPAGGNHFYTVNYAGDANYALSTASNPNPAGPITIATAAPTSTTVTDSPVGTSALGQPIVLTATVTGVSGAAVPTGTVTFKYNGIAGSSLGTVTLSAGLAPALRSPMSGLRGFAPQGHPGTGVATLTLTTQPVGTLANIVVLYSGDTNYSSSDSSGNPVFGHNITADPTTVTIGSNLSSVTAGTAVVLTATLVPQYTVPGGTAAQNGAMNFYYTPAGGAQTAITCASPGLTGYVYSCTWTPATNGIYAVTAQYVVGTDGNYLGSAMSPSTTITVGANPTTNTLAITSGALGCTGNTTYCYGEALTFTATMAATAGGSSPYPQGTIQFYDGGALIGSAALASATATTSTAAITISILAPQPASHSITATYVPSNSQTPGYAASTSNVLAPVIAKAATTVSQVVTQTSTAFGAPVTLQTVLSITAPGDSGTGFIPASQTITFYDGSTPIGTATVNGPGTYSVTVSTLSVNSHTNINAQYNGDTNYAQSAVSTAATQVITKTNTNATVTSNPASPLSYGQSVTFTVTTTSVNSTPVAGTATLRDINSGGDICGLTFTAGTATCTVAATTANKLGATAGASTIHDVRVVNGVDTSYTFTSVDENLTVNPAATQTVLIDSAPSNTSSAGVSVTFTATVSVTAPGVASPGGTVLFSNGSTNTLPAGCLTAALSVVNATTGTASCTYTFPTAATASYVITATYSGDVNTATSTTALTHYIGSPGPGIVLTTSNAGSTSVYGQQISLTVTVTNPTGQTNAPAPAGTVAIYNGNIAVPANQLATMSLAALSAPNNGQSSATFILQGTTYVPGNYAFTAVFSSADHNYSNGDSGVLNFVVAPEQVTVSAVNSSDGTPVYSESITLTATVTPKDAVSLYGGWPTGVVQFLDGTTVIGTGVPTHSGTTLTGTLTGVNTLIVGGHQITAQYLTDNNYSGGTSPTLTGANLTVSKASTQVSVPTFTVNSVSASSVSFSGSVTISSTVSPVAPAAAGFSRFAASDSIAFYDGSAVPANLLGTGTVSGGGAAITIAALPGGGLIGPNIETAHSIIAVFTNTDPNYTTSTSGGSQLTVTKATPTVSVVPSVTSPVFYQPETLTATITPPTTIAGSSNLPGGTVTFSSNGSVVGTANVVSAYGVSTATLVLPTTATSVPALAVGVDAITAVYNGDANYVSAPMSGTLSITVAKAGTTVSLSSSAQAGLATQSITFTAVVSVTPPGSVGSTVITQPSGTIQFYTTLGGNMVTLGTSPLNTVPGQNSAPNTYQATLVMTPSMLVSLNLSLTTMQVYAYYSGDGNYLNNTSPVWTQAMNKATTVIAMTASPNPVIVGGAVTVTATVTAIPPSTTVLPTGNVVFFDGSISLNGQPGLTSATPLVNGVATFVAPSLGVGVHPISAQYQGDANFQPTEGQIVSVTVTKVPSALTLTASATSAVASQPLTFVATISPTAPAGVNQPSGQVTLLDGSNVICVSSVQAGVASFTFPSLACSGTLTAGNHNLNAMYPGDGVWTSANSSYIAVIVSPAITNTTVVSSADPSVYGQAVTFTVSSAVAYPGTVPATGTVQLFDNAVALGNAVSINNGTVQITIPTLPVGTHNIIASYVGGASFSSSSSPALTQIVNKAPTTTTLAVNPAATSSGNQIVLTAVVVVPTPGAGVPSGNVVFTDATSGTVLGTVILGSTGNVLTATLTTNKVNQSSAPRLLVATYQGDANFASSASQAQSEVVNGNSISVLNGASYMGTNFAPDGAAAIFVTGIVNTTLVAPSLPLPNSLAGVTVTVTDSQGIARQAGLYFVSPSQINFDMPTNTAIGLATVTVNNSNGGAASGVILVTSTAPGIFTANQNGMGVAQALFVDVTPAGVATRTNTAVYNGSTGTWAANPLTMVAGDTYAVELYGTGVRYAGNGTVTATINGQSVTVLYAGAQPQYPGLDQIDLQLPSSLKGAGGPVTILLSVNGQAANAVTVNIN